MRIDDISIRKTPNFILINEKRLPESQNCGKAGRCRFFLLTKVSPGSIILTLNEKLKQLFGESFVLFALSVYFSFPAKGTRRTIDRPRQSAPPLSRSIKPN